MAFLNNPNSLENMMRFGYALILATIALMIWASSARAIKVPDQPCAFNAMCTCSNVNSDNYGSVKCVDVPFPALPKALNISKVYTLKIENTGLKEIEPFFLLSTSLYKLQISHNKLFEIDDEAFSGLERTLWQLVLSYNQLVEIPTNAMRYLQKLNSLDLSGNQISSVNPNSFRGLQTNLQILSLADNSLSVLTSEAFEGLPNLVTLDLSSNNLHEISPDVFREQMNSLTKVILADNLLSEIPYRQVSMLKSLKHLDISKNLITSFKIYPDDQSLNVKLSLEQLHLEYNQIYRLTPASFQYFNMVNQTFLDYNPIHQIGDDAFQQARIRELYIRHCRLEYIEPSAFSGLESSLQVLDLSGNNISSLPDKLLNSFDLLRTLGIKENKILSIYPHSTTFTSFQSSLLKLDVSGDNNGPTNLQEIRRLKNLRSLSIGRFGADFLSSENFLEFSMELENLKIYHAGLKTIKAHAFQHVRGIKRLDLSENRIDVVEKGAFTEIGHSLLSLRISHGFSNKMTQLPDLRELTSIDELDFSNNRIKAISDTAFHSMKSIRVLKISDNLVELLPKGLFQRDIHQKLEEISMEFNMLRHISTHTFVDLEKLHTINLRDNRIERLERRSFMNLDSLQHLNLKGNKLISISDEAFQNLPRLSFLDISFNNQLKSFDFDYFDQVGTLTSLFVNASHNDFWELSDNTTTYFNAREQGFVHSHIKFLDLSHNNISRINSAFFRPAEGSLLSLDLSYNYLTNTSREIFENFYKLQNLDLSDNFIDFVAPDSFRNTRRLQILDLHQNKLTDLNSESFRSLGDLRVVDLSYNSLKSIPDSLFISDDLERLDLSHNQLPKIPVTSLGNVAALSLSELDLSHNAIVSIHSMDLSNKFRRLSKLNMANNRLTRLDEAAFSALPNLAILDLSNNKELEVYGRVFIGLESNLMELNLNNISIFQAPDLALPNLRVLKIAHNNLPTFPPEYATNLSSLRTFDLSDNDLTMVPIITHSLDYLSSLSLAKNPISTLTNTSLLGAADVLEFLDISHLPLTTLENGVLNKFLMLRKIRISTYPQLSNFNIPTILNDVDSLREIWIESPPWREEKIISKEGFETYQWVQDAASDLRQELFGYLPRKVKKITVSGSGFTNLAEGIFDGVQSSSLHISFHNTTLSGLPAKIFQQVGAVKNISIDIISNNMKINSIPNPNTALFPNQPDVVMLTKMNMHYTNLACDCDIGWIEFWQRKKRQYFCGEHWIEDSPVMSEINENQHDCEDPYIDDDLRSARCSNKKGEPLIEILKSELECGWNSSSRMEATHIFILVAFAIGLPSFLI